MGVFNNRIVPYSEILLEKKQVQKYLKPNSLLKLNKYIRSRLNPYSQSRLRTPLSKKERILLLSLRRLLKVRCLKKFS